MGDVISGTWSEGREELKRLGHKERFWKRCGDALTGAMFLSLAAIPFGGLAWAADVRWGLPLFIVAAVGAVALGKAMELPMGQVETSRLRANETLRRATESHGITFQEKAV